MLKVNGIIYCIYRYIYMKDVKFCKLMEYD